MRHRSLRMRISRGEAALCLLREATTRGCLAPPRAKSPNLAPLAAALGLAPANGGALGPADIGFDVILRGEQWKLSRLAATIGGVKASGELTFQPQPEATLARCPRRALRSREPKRRLAPGLPPVARRRLRRRRSMANSLSSACRWAAVLALALGPPPSRAGTRWSEARFAPPPLRPPSAAVKFKVETLDMTDALIARDFVTTLRFDKGRLDLDDFAMRIAGGGASGHATLRRDARHRDADRRAGPRRGRARPAGILGPCQRRG